MTPPRACAGSPRPTWCLQPRSARPGGGWCLSDPPAPPSLRSHIHPSGSAAEKRRCQYMRNGCFFMGGHTQGLLGSDCFAKWGIQSLRSCKEKVVSRRISAPPQAPFSPCGGTCFPLDLAPNPSLHLITLILPPKSFFSSPGVIWGFPVCILK